MKVLIIDDSAEDRHTIIRLLKNIYENVEISEASDVANGQELVRVNKFDVVLVDYHMPDGSGLDIIRMKKNYVNFDYPALLLTGQGDDHIDQKASDTGAADYIDKNDLNKVSIERSIRYAIKNNSLLQELKSANKKLAELEKFRAHVFDVAHESLSKPINQIRSSLKKLQTDLKPLINNQQSSNLETLNVECDKFEEYLSQFYRAKDSCSL